MSHETTLVVTLGFLDSFRSNRFVWLFWIFFPPNFDSFMVSKRVNAYDCIWLACAMVVDLEKMTVIELKSLLREKGLLVSGNKTALIERLTNHQPEPSVWESNEADEEGPSEGKFRELNCSSCNVILRVPIDYNGMIACPTCSTKQDSRGTKSPSPFGDNGLTPQQISACMMIIGLAIGIAAVWMIVSEWNLFWDCESDYIGDVSYEERGCGQGTFMTTMFTSCCLLLPIGFFLGMFGYNIMENQNSVTMGVMPTGGPIDPSEPSTVPQAPIPQTAAFGKALQATAVGYGVGVATVGAIIATGIALIGILGLFLFFSY